MVCHKCVWVRKGEEGGTGGLCICSSKKSSGIQSYQGNVIVFSSDYTGGHCYILLLLLELVLFFLQENHPWCTTTTRICLENKEFLVVNSAAGTFHTLTEGASIVKLAYCDFGCVVCVSVSK